MLFETEFRNSISKSYYLPKSDNELLNTFHVFAFFKLLNIDNLEKNLAYKKFVLTIFLVFDARGAIRTHEILR